MSHGRKDAVRLPIDIRERLYIVFVQSRWTGARVNVPFSNTREVLRGSDRL